MCCGNKRTTIRDGNPSDAGHFHLGNDGSEHAGAQNRHSLH